MKPTHAATVPHAGSAERMSDDETKADEPQSALQASLAPLPPLQTASSAEQQQSDSSNMRTRPQATHRGRLLCADPQPAAMYSDHSEHNEEEDEDEQMQRAIALSKQTANLAVKVSKDEAILISSEDEAEPAPKRTASTRRSKRGRGSEAADAAAAPLAPTASASSARSSKHARTDAASSAQQSESTSGKKDAGRRSRAELSKKDEPASEPAAAAASSVSSSKRKSVASSKSTAAASSSIAIATASSARPSLFSRLDADSLGIALSFLDANEFHAARLVSKQWHAASAKRTAWPQLQVDEFIRLLQNDAYDDPSRRRLVVNRDEKLRSFVQRFSVHPSHDVFGKHASEVKFVMHVPSPASVFAARQSLLQSVLPILASQFQFLSTLTLHHCFLEQAAVVRLYTSVANRLRALILLGCDANSAFLQQLSLLTQLRVLVVDCVPPAESLRSLVSLQYLHVWCKGKFTSNHGRVLRWLSVHHALRSFSIKGNDRDRVRLDELIATSEPVEPAPHQYPPWAWWMVPEQRAPTIVLAPPLDWSVPARLTDLSLGALVDPFLCRWHFLASLRRLEFECEVNPRLDFLNAFRTLTPEQQHTHRASVHAMMQRITEVRMRLRIKTRTAGVDLERPLQELRVCRNLRRLTLSALALDPTLSYSIRLPPLLQAVAATIEEMRFGVELDAFTDETEKEASTAMEHSVWASFAACKQLRMLEIAFNNSMPDSFLRALASLPAFRSLELSFRVDQPRMPPMMFRCMLESATWSALHLHWLSLSLADFDPLQPSGLQDQLVDLQRDSAAILSPNSAERVRLYVHLASEKRVRTYRIVTAENSGALVWAWNE